MYTDQEEKARKVSLIEHDRQELYINNLRFQLISWMKFLIKTIVKEKNNRKTKKGEKNDKGCKHLG